MKPVDHSVLRPGVSFSEVLSWASYDFANSGYSTVVLTAVYNAFFVSVVAGDADWATLAWTAAVSGSNLLSLIVIPYISAQSDQKANKKIWLFILTMLCIVSTAMLAFSGPGTLALATVFIIISNLAFNAGVAVNSAFLSELAEPHAFGKVSGWGWGFGYIGGIVTLAVCLVIVQTMDFLSMNERVGYCMVATAVIFLIGTLPMFLCVKERARPQASGAKTSPITEFRATVQMVFSQDKSFSWLCLAGVFYQAGIAIVITLSAVYAQIVLKFTTEQTITLILAVNFAAAAGAWYFGYLEDRLGHKKVLLLTIGIWISVVVIAAASYSHALFWVAATLAGIAMGSSQSAGRSMVASLAPERRLTQYYSLWNAAVWIANIIGPISYGLITWISMGNQRIAILITGLYFVLGAICLKPVVIPKTAPVNSAKE